MAKFAVDINTYFTIEGDSKEQVEEFVKLNFYTADIESGEAGVDGEPTVEKNDFGIEIVEVQ